MKSNLSFDAILHQIMIEETAPGKDALLRWQKLYPKYHYALEEYFEAWARDAAEPPAPEMPEILDSDDSGGVPKSVAYAMDMLRKQGRIIPKTLIETLKPFDQLVLTAVVKLEGTGDSADIREKIREISGRDVLLASTIASLNRLESKRLLEWRLADPKSDPDKEGVRYFMVTIAGERALKHAPATATAVADFQVQGEPI